MQSVRVVPNISGWQRIAVIALTGVLGLTGLVQAEEKPKKPATTVQPAEETPKSEAIVTDKELDSNIAQLVKDLEADNFKTREDASKSLKKIGKPALPALEVAAESDSPNLAWQAKIIINAIKKAERKKWMDAERHGATAPNAEQQPGTAPQSARQSGTRLNFHISGTPGMKSYSFQRDATGRITVTITDNKDGKQVTNTYSADSAEEFKQKYPDIAKEYGIDIGGTGPNVIQIPQIELDDLWEDFGKSWGRRWDEWEKEMERFRKMMQDSAKNWRQPEGSPANRGNPGDIRPHQGEVPPPEPGNEASDDDNEEADAQPQQPTPPADKDAKPAESAGLRPLDLGADIEFIEPSLRAQLNLDVTSGGVMVAKIVKDGLADNIGLKRYDVILSVNGAPVVTVWEFRRLMKPALATGEVKLEIIRQAKHQVVKWKK